MKIAIIGTGYVGLITGVGLAELGHSVVGVDENPEKIKLLERGVEPFYEPGLAELLKKNIKAKRISFTLDLTQAVNKTDYIFICVGTPPRQDGGADLSYLLRASRAIKKAARGPKMVIIKSTVPLGTNDRVEKILNSSGSAKFEVVSMPEFLREGKAVYDFFHPDRMVIGVTNPKAGARAGRLFGKNGARKVIVNRETGELIKYASNAFLATKISFINDIANLCERVKANVEQVAYGMGLDPRIAPAFLKAGLGYGGSCFPKDVKALVYIAKVLGYDFRMLKAVIAVNSAQRIIFAEKIKKYFGRLKGKKIAVLGLAFKGETDDLRESAAIDIAEYFAKQGAKVAAFDPKAMANAMKVLPKSVVFAKNEYEAIKNADALVIVTEWPQFAKLNLTKVKKLLNRPVIFDGKNLYDSEVMKKKGFKYFSVGRN